ncbi:MAG: HlyD family efflux transporter periplasmic adaptor subunit [Prolixibacteraceae bacterium]|jgi:membrane fusion protein, multidrug efflux system|nr:HlyD family efflux transporter periplasmic adaptor subunit [Prolixibacteraceae bacterium]MBT6007460.1 HlyD family efflux transporter periplasmic adaptor subunit [Prolixibacteraceae bacterium]MBT6764997.1 HlyD family efflux transporter periplasmic adaptor subunit [Prolixibacteraceae bacterium]MBT6999225.1 HlyD family efflux transporter periplasmic adaptor subunit [Prolixibacteraceae bacterium]MBT7393292.1 HlyD family efflux transporter periplasmic adaptor subunit [Prolixibacteraceae bacterium
MRKYISIILGITLIAISVLIAVVFIKNSDKKKSKIAKTTKTVFVNIVENKTIPIHINSSGSLIAKNKIEIYSEVQGVLNISKKEFKAGTYYSKGDIILSINTDEHLANLRSLKSNLHNSLLSIMPDIKVDFPLEYEKWQAYLSSFDVDHSLLALPKTSSDREKFFITGKNIYTQYYNLEYLNVRLSKHTVRAPYNGMLTEALVTQGTLIRQGQKLGDFINADTYEMELAIKSSFIDFVKIGNPVTLNHIKHTKSWQGKVIRINGKIDQASQTIKVFIEVKATDLREGMYLVADLVARSETNAFEIDSKLLFEKNKLFAVADSSLFLVQINPVYFNDKTVIVKGLEDGTKLISQPVPGAFEGMKVKIIKAKKVK